LETEPGIVKGGSNHRDSREGWVREGGGRGGQGEQGCVWELIF